MSWHKFDLICFHSSLRRNLLYTNAVTRRKKNSELMQPAADMVVIPYLWWAYHHLSKTHTTSNPFFSTEIDKEQYYDEQNENDNGGKKGIHITANKTMADKDKHDEAQIVQLQNSIRIIPPPYT